MNREIWQTRVSGGPDELRLAELADEPTPMLPLLLAAHPSFNKARLLRRAKETLPASQQ